MTLNSSSLEFVMSNKYLKNLHSAVFESIDFDSSAEEIIRINRMKARIS